jgi:hypothetical protein
LCVIRVFKKQKIIEKREKNSKVNLILSHVNQTFGTLNWTSSLFNTLILPKEGRKKEKKK